MQEERAKAAFNIRDMTYLLDGGRHATEVELFSYLPESRLFFDISECPYSFASV